MSLRVALISVAVIAVPLGFGALLGVALRHWRGRRFAGLLAALVFILGPMLLFTGLVLQFPVVGLWDAPVIGFFVGIGIEWTAHRAFSGKGEMALSLASLVISLLLLEMACRFLLPPSPRFPSGNEPHLWLADAMRADSRNHSWDLRSKEIVCSIVYGEQYRGILDVSSERDILVPASFSPRPDATRRILHIGDSMTFGFGVARDQTLTADLERIEPGTQHINGGIPGTAPDAYLLVLRRWLALHPVDLVVMYVFEGNDLVGLDDRYPCCDWQPLLTYAGAKPAMQCETAAAVDFGRAGATWLRYNSPPPYLVRALIGTSAAAAHVGAAIVNAMASHPLFAPASRDVAMAHLESIVRATHDDLHERNIPFVVVVLPDQGWVSGRSGAEHMTPMIMNMAQRVGVNALDASERLRSAVAAGEQIYLDHDPHFSAAGHQVMATWLHDQLPRRGVDRTSSPGH